MVWEPPGKDCGACGSRTCDGFVALAHTGKKDLKDCPFYRNPSAGDERLPAPSAWSGKDIAGFDYDFVLEPFPGEPSARKHIQPFRAELIDQWGIKAGDIIMGRPVEPSCPIHHILRVLRVDMVTGIITCYAVGPHAARKSVKVHDVHAYREIAMEGMVQAVKHEPLLGYRQRFLPANCMRQMVHSGVVQMALKKSDGMHVRIEEIQMHGKREKLKDVTIRPGDAVSITDGSGARKSVVIDGIDVLTSEGTRITRTLGDGEPAEGSGGGHGQGHGKRHDGSGGGKGQGRGRHRGDE
jgi:uncharacterized Fe-S cluster-containing protein